jgi:hypothetical protein
MLTAGPLLATVMTSMIGYGSIMDITEPKDKQLPMLDSEIEKLLNTRPITNTSFQNTSDLNSEMLKDLKMDIMEKSKIGIFA